MDISITKNISLTQIDQLFRYLQREPSMRDYVLLYPDFAQRFPAIVSALPEPVLLDAILALEQAETPKTDLVVLTETFCLTEAEGRLALLLLAGHSPVEIADLRQVSRHTIRNQLQSVYDKTATRNQPELIRRLHDALSAK